MPETPKIKTYVAQYLTSEQYTECEWKAIQPSLSVDDNTTIGQIRQWMAKNQAERIDRFTVTTLQDIA